jgi:hypothetical protein
LFQIDFGFFSTFETYPPDDNSMAQNFKIREFLRQIVEEESKHTHTSSLYLNKISKQKLRVPRSR